MKKKGIVIASHINNLLFLNDLKGSLANCNYPVIVCENNNNYNSWELGALLVGCKLFDEFIFLHDTTLIKDLSYLDVIFNDYDDNQVSFLGKFNGYMGKYVSIDIVHELYQFYNKYPFETLNKETAIKLEYEWSQLMIKLYPDYIEMFPESNGWAITDTIIERHNQRRMLYENPFLIKFKGTWE